MIQSKSYIVITHIAAWILFLSLPVLFITSQSGYDGILSTLASPYTWLFFITYIFIFYLHSWWLIPKLYLKKKFFLYASSLFILLITVWLLKPFDRMVSNLGPDTGLEMPNPGPPPPPVDDFKGPPTMRQPGDKPPGAPMNVRGLQKIDVVSIFFYFTILAMSMAIQVRVRLRATEQRALQAEADKANAELSFLKAQINPHFLFNTLNNIYSLAASKSDNTAESILKLSNIMRYVTDDVREEFVPLENEMDFIRDYIDLQRLRLGDKMNVNFIVSGKIAGKKIAPLILMTFIENVFKYGISNREPSAIDIQLTVDDQAIRFYCSNKLYETPRNVESTGIGIENTRQRLEHLYAGKYDLSIDKTNGRFSVQLTLPG